MDFDDPETAALLEKKIAQLEARRRAHGIGANPSDDFPVGKPLDVDRPGVPELTHAEIIARAIEIDGYLSESRAEGYRAGREIRRLDLVVWLLAGVVSGIGGAVLAQWVEGWF